MRILALDEIQALLPSIDLVAGIEAGFVAYSEGRCVVPPVGELLLQDPPGEVHIKYGYVQGDESYVVKIASGFYENAQIGQPTGNGVMLVFSQQTGALQAVLADEGHLTDVRTAVAGSVVAKHLGPSSIKRIGIIGSGTQARLQLQHLAAVTPCREVVVWARNRERMESYREDVEHLGFSVEIAADTSTVLAHCNLIVTTTASTDPLIRWSSDIEHGMQITAVGSDTPSKRELDASIMDRADLVVVDSRSQCETRGETRHAVAAGIVQAADVVELGDVISGLQIGRTDDDQVTVADLTGVAVQDIAIARAVLDA